MNQFGERKSGASPDLRRIFFVLADETTEYE